MHFISTTRLVLFAFVGLASIVAEARGQKSGSDGPVGIFDSGAQYDTFMTEVKRAAYGEGGTPELQAMVPMLNDIALDKPVGWTANEYGIQGGALGLLSDPSIREELEMVDNQYQELTKFNAEVQARAAAQIRQLDFSDRENLVQRIQAIRNQAVEDLNGVLLPHQLERLQQIRMQSLLRRKSFVEILTTDPVKETLEISDDQASDLKTKESEIEEELRREIARLREKARQKLLSSLRPTQKEAVKEMFGDSFEFKANGKPQKKRQTKSQKKSGKAKNR